MAPLCWYQLVAMLKKDQLIRKRHYIVTLFELFLPIFLVYLQILATDNPVVQPQRPKSVLSPQARSIPSHTSDVFYYEFSFRCDLIPINYPLAPTIYHTSPGNISGGLLPDSRDVCRGKSRSFNTELEVIRAWSDGFIPLYGANLTNPDIGIFFHSLDLDQGIANYTVSGKEIDFSQPTGEPVYETYDEYIRAQSIVNILMAYHPGDPLLSDFEYRIMTKLFGEGNPITNTATDVPKEEINPFNFGLAAVYTYLEIGFIFMSTIITRRIVREKCTNSKELLRIMGLSNSVYWISHFINYLALSIFHSTMITVLYSIYSYKNIFQEWQPGLFWLNYLIVSVTSILFTFAFTTILTRPIISVLIVIIVRQVLITIPIYAFKSVFTFWRMSAVAWTNLLPSGQLYNTLNSLFSEEKSDASNLLNSLNVTSHLKLGTIYLIAIFSWFLYSVLIWYLDAVWPWQPGTPKPWYFPGSGLWRAANKDNEIISSGSKSPLNSAAFNYYNEPEQSNLKSNIQCINVCKAFGSMGNRKYAVNGLNMNIKKGQITVLLGHNGAGKTTTMSMMTGILTSSSGKMLINGIDVHKDTVAARRCLALCPQTDLLFEELTVFQNLDLCAGLRGLNKETKGQLIPLNIKRVNLTEKVNTLASNLSGGMRRRLQLALALSTASEILILDEPTSGLDPESRRQLWDLLLELRKDITILLTTHFMEEADALGDRIIIMASGKVKCSGSPMFLKKKFGTGHSIRLAKNPSSFNGNLLTEIIKSHFINADVSFETNEEVIYNLNQNIGGEDDSIITLANLCDTLDANLQLIGLTSYGISVTTLEDVFLRATQDNLDGTKSTALQIDDRLFEMNKILNYTKLNGFLLLFQRLRGLMMKRFHYARRHYKTIGLTIILPVFFIYFTFAFARGVSQFYENGEHDYPGEIPLDVKYWYGNNAKAVIRTDNPDSRFVNVYRDIMRESGIEVITIQASLSMEDYFKSSSQTREQFMNENIFGIIADPGERFIAWANPTAALSLPLSAAAWQNAFLRYHKALERSRLIISYKSMPNRATDKPLKLSIIGRVSILIFSPVAFCLIAVSYFLFPSIESQNKANLIQKMSGINALVFWLGHYLFDIFYHILISLIVFFTMIATDKFITISFNLTGSMLLLLIIYGMASIPFFYLFSFLPISTDRGFSMLSIFSIIGTIIFSITLSIIGVTMALIGDKQPTISYLADLFPPFAVSFGISKVYGGAILEKLCKDAFACPIGNPVTRRYCCTKNLEYRNFEPFSFEANGILPEIILLLSGSLIYFAICVIVDMNLHRVGYCFEKIRRGIRNQVQIIESTDDTEDEDVKRERERVKQFKALAIDQKEENANGESLIVDELRKDFGSFRAVDKVSFGVHKAECFGLLGVNGAGKTTTFRMLTGDIMITSGDAYVNSFDHWYSVRNNLLNFQQSISYCPQYDALIDNLTPKETLTLFARIRGMPENKVTDNVNYIIQSTDLSQFSQTPNQDLSGGNKRKLSLAIAAIAKPEVIFLDEPTTGVDPSSRRKIWSTLIYLRDTSGSSIVLTSHSMDECEALCSRIGIMARGNFKCLGSSQHLKDKFGQGFTLIIKMKGEIANDLNGLNQVEKIKKFIKDKFSSSVLRDHHHTILHYHITDTSSRWGHMLRCLDEGKKSLPIEDFTLTGTSLEQIFLSFAKQS